MKFIPMNRRATVSVKIPPLSGGVNLYDLPTEAADNQLIACENVWWHKGALRTRPGYQRCGINQYLHGQKQMVNEREMLITRLQSRGALGGCYLSAYHVDVERGGHRIGGKDCQVIHGDTDQTVLGFRVPQSGDNNWYFLLSGGAVMQGSENEDSQLVHTEPYVPTVLINGYGSATKPTADLSADLYEDYNMLTRAYTCEYTTDGESQYWPLPEKNLGVSEDGTTSARVTLTVESAGATRTIDVALGASGAPQSVELTAAEAGVSGYTSIRLYISLSRGGGYLLTKLIGRQEDSGVEMPCGCLPRVTNNNLQVTVWRNEECDKNRETICKMTRCVWYGGARSGVAGGTRLFVCGNPDEPNLLHWSGIEHPLYFPEHNYNRIGDASQAITAFGKQGDLLILFKEHQMYAAQYDATEEEDYNYAKASGVATTTYMAQFPVTPLQDTIGCDCPDTVRLVNNRLVWANSNGHVYLLTAVNQYSERNVRDISRNVTEDMARQGAALKTAVAGEYEGYYLLAAGERVYLLDTQNSAFSSFNYYSSEDTARKALPWYIWQMPIGIYGMVSDGYRVLMAPSEDLNDVFELGGDTDEGAVICGHFATKMFDFGMTDRTKSVGQMYIAVEVAPEGRMAVTYLTEKGNRRDPYEIDGGVMASLGRAGCMRYMRLTPYMHLVQTFGLQVDVTAAVAVDSITLKVKQQGVVR